MNIALFYCLIEKTVQGLKLFQDSLNVSTGCIMIIFIKKSFLSSPTINDLINGWGIYLILEFQEAAFNREEKSLCHVAMVAEFLDDKPKMSLKKWIRTVSNFIDPFQFHLICQMLAKFSGVECERTVSKFRKRKRTFLCFVHLLHKAGMWNWEHSCCNRATATKKCTKKRDARANLLFC